jgi:mono/diheme cytochrome c family protein
MGEPIAHPEETAMSKRPITVAALALAALAGTAFTFGGWCVITVDDLPEYVTVGKPTEIAFTIRQHGLTLMDRLQPVISAKSGTAEVKANATGWVSGRYTATLVVPKDGNWTVTINSGFMNNKATLAPIPAIAAGATPPKPAIVADRGERLFIAKGCVTCHVHGEVAGSGLVPVGPNLTPKRYQPDFLAKFLADPSIARTPGAKEIMPKLELKPIEVVAITAFLNNEKQALGVRH